MTRPEVALRTLALTAATLAAFAPLAWHLAHGPSGARGAWVRDVAVGAALVLLAAWAAWRAEGSPVDLEVPAARRARRFAPLAVGIVVSGALLFPTWIAWGLPTLAYFVNLPLVAFWHVPTIRPVSLALVTAAALAGNVLPDGGPLAPWALGVVGLAWAVAPPLDRLAAVRARLTFEGAPGPGRTGGRPGPRAVEGLPHALAGAALVLAVGGATALAAALLLPPSRRDFVTVDMLRPAPGTLREPFVDVPVGRLLGLAAAAAAVLVLGNALGAAAGRRRGLGPARPLDLAAGRARPIDAAEVERALAPWPPGPRREVVRAWLGHLARLDALGVLRAPGRTPRALARTFARALGAALPAAAAARLAAAFERARWSPAPVSPEDAARAREDAAALDAALERPEASRALRG